MHRRRLTLRGLCNEHELRDRQVVIIAVVHDLAAEIEVRDDVSVVEQTTKRALHRVSGDAIDESLDRIKVTPSDATTGFV